MKLQLTKNQLLKIKAVESATPEGHLAFVPFYTTKEIERLSGADAKAFGKARGMIVHLMNVHNAMLDASASLEVKQAAAAMEVSIDARIERLEAFLNERAATPKRRRRVARKSQTKLAKKMRKLRRTETPKEKRARLDKRNAALNAWKKREGIDGATRRRRRAKSRAKAA